MDKAKMDGAAERAKHLKFNLYNVRDDEGHKAKIYYSIQDGINERLCVTLYAATYVDSLAFVGDVENGTDVMTDYFEKDRVRIYHDDPRFPAALAAAQRKNERDREKIALARREAMARRGA